MEPKYSKLNTACLLVLTAVAITVALIYTKIVLVPFVFSIFAYSIISPTIHWLENQVNLHRSVAVTLVVMLFLLGSFLLMYFVISSVGNFLNEARSYQGQISQFLEWLSQKSAEYGYDIELQTLRDVLNRLGVFSLAEGVTGWIVRFLANFFLVVVIVVFLVAGEGSGAVQNKFFFEVQSRISQYIAIKLMVSITTGILVGSVLNIFNVELVFMFAILTMLLNFIPSLGSIVSTALPIPVLLVKFGLGWQFFVVMFLLSLIQCTFGYFIEPKMMGDSMELHPITVLLCLIFWGLVWGVSGLFLGVPITAIIRIVLSEIEITEPISELLAGRIPEDSAMGFEI